MAETVVAAAGCALALLARAAIPLYGPRGGDVLILGRGGKAVITNSSAAAVAAAVSSSCSNAPATNPASRDVLPRWAAAHVAAHGEAHGDGCGRLALMLHAGWAEAVRSSCGGLGGSGGAFVGGLSGGLRGGLRGGSGSPGVGVRAEDPGARRQQGGTAQSAFRVQGLECRV